MPISEDEFEYQTVQEPQISNMSKAELRKTHKPIMEKRRRARINQCLNEIKSLILEAMNKDPARHSKLEKADILEMAVKHLQNVQRQQLALAMATDPSVLRKFKTGFNECASEIERYISRMDGVDGGVKERIANHLQKCISGLEQVAHFNFPGFNNLPFMTGGSNVFVGNSSSNSSNNNPDPSQAVGDQNNNSGIQLSQGIQLIPSRLPTGELALLVPNSSNLSYFPGLGRNLQQSSRPSAFATVIPSSGATDLGKSPDLGNIDRTDRANLSPRGFRPVQVSKIKSDEPQVAQISSSTSFGHHPDNPELKTIKFPILKEIKKVVSPKKVVEPLCIITNQNERYKQAQVKEDSIDYEENRQQGVKRKFSELSQSNQGLLLTLVPQDFSYPPTKSAKLHSNDIPATISSAFSYVSANSANERKFGDEQIATSSKNNDNEPNSDMWRPW